jgi:nicotinamidase-related amidase
LLGIDLQNCFVSQSPFAAECGLQLVKRLNHLASSVRSHGGLVIWTRHVVRPDHANAGMLARTVPPVQAGLIDDGPLLPPSILQLGSRMAISLSRNCNLELSTERTLRSFFGREASRLSLSAVLQQTFAATPPHERRTLGNFRSYSLVTAQPRLICRTMPGGQ